MNVDDATSINQAIVMQNLRFGYKSDPDVLDIPEFSVATAEGVFLQGASGSGKSTLLSLIAGILAPRAGEVAVLGRNISADKGSVRDRFRSDHLGVIFQQFNLLPYLSVDENVALPCRYSVRRRERACEIDGTVENSVSRLLTDLGIDGQLRQRRSRDLSVGQQQRVAAARALIGRPELVIADEPTSALDFDRRQEFVQLLISECRQVGSSIVFVSHDTSLASHFDKSIEIQQINLAAGAA